MTDTNPEFSRILTLEELRGGAVRKSIEANAEERRRLSERLGLAALETLTAKVTLTPRASGRVIHAEGAFDARLTQTCVITLEPLPTAISETFEIRLAVEPDGDDGKDIVDIDPGAEDEPEPIEGDSVDIGELVAQHLSLALDPYPRAEGASLESGTLAADETPNDGPFAKLARLKPKA